MRVLRRDGFLQADFGPVDREPNKAAEAIRSPLEQAKEKLDHMAKEIERIRKNAEVASSIRESGPG